MKHYIKNFMLATSFKTFDHTTVRFFTLGGCSDVGIPNNQDDEFSTALEKGKYNLVDMTYDDYTKTIWEICNYITKNISDTKHSAVDVIEGIGSSKILIEKLDYYNIMITLRVSNKNQSKTDKIILDSHDLWFLQKLCSFCTRVLTRRIYESL